MSLYPIIPIDVAASQNGMFEIPPGNLATVTLTVPVDGGVTVTANQLGFAQDFSMRAWLSLVSDGVAVTRDPMFWSLNRRPDTIVFYDQNMVVLPVLPVLSDNARSVAMEPGDYVFNILNLVNQKNFFTYSAAVV